MRSRTLRSLLLVVPLSVAFVMAAAGQSQKGASPRAFTLEVIIDKVDIAAGTALSVEGLGIDHEVAELVDANGVIRKRPGPPRFLNITLKRPFIGSKTDPLTMWVDQARAGGDNVPRKTVTIVVRDRLGNATLWTLNNVFPKSSKSGFTLDGKGATSMSRKSCWSSSASREPDEARGSSS